MDANEYAMTTHLALRAYDDSRPRSQQTSDHRLGVSDVGNCPQYAVLLTKQTPFSDAPSRSAAIMGTFIHDGLERAKKHANPNLVLGAEVTITMPNGVTLTGHPDEIDPDENSVTDDKTSDGLGLVRHSGPSEQQRYQVALYALGAIQSGLLDPDKPLITRIAWYDRTGKEDIPHVWQKVWEPTDVDEAEGWLDSVIYAVKHDEDGERTKPVDWCAMACPYYSVCRLPDLPEVDDLITDPEVRTAAVAYRQGLELEKEGAAIKRGARSVLDGISGIIPVDTDHRLRLRWVSVAAQDVKATTRQAHKRMDLREV